MLLKASSRKRNSSEKKYGPKCLTVCMYIFFSTTADSLSDVPVHEHTYIAAISQGALTQDDRRS